MVGAQVSADNGIFGQTGPKVGSFDAGYGSSHMARLVGESAAPYILRSRDWRGKSSMHNPNPELNQPALSIESSISLALTMLVAVQPI